ncbi:MAG: hypothetical protein OXG55_14420 [bacterium]|nr:hypothetical protein [bacterium]MCY3951127.1 hypothetical protein [bacterium]MCY4104434.1 hypothetical protein [bacterium]
MVGPTSRIQWRYRAGGLLLAVGWELLRRPRLWPEAFRQLPTVASGRYRGFRSVTAYGDPQRQPAPADVLAWLRWARSFRRACTRHG